MLNALAKEAFPEAEYLEPEKIIEMSRKIDLDFWAMYDSQKFVGFMTVTRYEDMAYLFFLAVDSKARGRGYGSKALAELEKVYPNYTQVVDLEMLDDFAKNCKQRISRRRFYQRNGYKPTGYFLLYFGIMLEIMSKSDKFDFEKCKKLLSTMPIEGFVPQYFQKV